MSTMALLICVNINTIKRFKCLKVLAGYNCFAPENWYRDGENTKLYANPFIETINDFPKNYVSAKASVTKKLLRQKCSVYRN